MRSRRVLRTNDNPPRYRVTHDPNPRTYATRNEAEKRASNLDARGWLRSSQG